MNQKFVLMIEEAGIEDHSKIHEFLSKIHPRQNSKSIKQEGF